MDAFEAVADPVRRDLIALLVARDRAVGDLAGRFAISRPAVSRHLRVLREAGVVEAVADGRRRLYRLRPGGLAVVRAWLDGVDRLDERTVESRWSERLDALGTEVRRTVRERGPGGARPRTTTDEPTEETA